MKMYKKQGGGGIAENVRMFFYFRKIEDKKNLPENQILRILSYFYK